MKMKREIIIKAGIAVTLLLVTSFGFTTVLYQNMREQTYLSAKHEEQAIRQVLYENAMAASYDTPDNTLSGIMTIVGRRRSIDTSKCPDDFRSAYKRYVRAWDEMLDQLLSHPEVLEDELFHKPFNELDIDFTYYASQNSVEDSVFQTRIQTIIQRQNNGADLSLCMLNLACYSEQIAKAWTKVCVSSHQHETNIK